MVLADRILNIPFVQRSDSLRTFVTAAWLGWQIESNWADPFLFAVYSFVRPIASVLILVVMYTVVTQGATEEPIFSYIYLGNALYILVGMIITGVSWAVIDDREHYRTAKQLYTTPMDHYMYLMGRGVARLIIGSISVIITIVFGVLLFDIPISFGIINWPLLIVSLALGIITLAAVGLIMGSATLMMARHFWSIGEAVAGGLYLFTGAIFPLETLPVAIRWLGFTLPITYWLELTRRALLGEAATGFPTLAGFTNMQLVWILVAFSVVLVAASIFIYRWAIVKAKDKGLIDLESAY